MNRSGSEFLLKIFFILFGLLLSVGSIHAIENTFTITASVIDDDLVAPTVPTGLTATPASSNQIDLVWNSSTDNVAVVGYRVYREGIIIATTSTNSYSDIGLFSSTLYSYNIDAFDGALNFSALSATTSASTLPEPSQTPGGSPRRNPSRIHETESIQMDIRVYPAITSAVLAWDTQTYARANVYWGESADYEIGVISGVIFQKNHVVKIENLVPKTQYFYRIELESNDGSITFFNGSFETNEDVTARPPQSIRLKAEAIDSSIVLSWDTVVTESVQVRLVRSDKFFPVDPYDGKVVYQGTRESDFVDESVEYGVTYYYALFVVDEDEMYSAPSIAKATVGMKPTSIFTGIPYSSQYEVALEGLDLADFDFVQKGVKLSFSGGGLNLLPDASTEILVGAEKIPLGIKTIGVTFIPKKMNGEPQTFLLMYSKVEDKYIGVIPALDSAQIYEIEINIFDTQNNKVKTLHVASYVEAKMQVNDDPGFIWKILWIIRDHYIFSLILLLIGFLIGFMARRL